MKAYEKAVEKLNNDNDLFNDLCEELDGYNGFLGDNRIFPMEYLDDFYCDTEPTEILNRAFFGYDGDYTTEDGSHPEPFNPNKNYFYYNGYGNLVSTYDRDYTGFFTAEEVLDEVIENRDYIYTNNDELDELLNQIEEESNN